MATKPNRFDYVKYDDKACNQTADFKSVFMALEELVEKAFPNGSRSKALVLTKLEEAYMWIGKTIRDEQIVRTGQAELQEGRNVG